MSSALSSIMGVYDASLQPIASLAALGVTVTPIDVVGAFRLALVIRQLREILHREHINKSKPTGGGTSGRPGKDRAEVESRARTRDLVTTLVMVYGGEAVVGAFSPNAFHRLVDVLTSVLIFCRTSPLVGYTAILHARGRHPRHVHCYTLRRRGSPGRSHAQSI